MTDPNTPPAASERMTAELQYIRLRAKNYHPSHGHIPAMGDVRFLLALVDKQAKELVWSETVKTNLPFYANAIDSIATDKVWKIEDLARKGLAQIAGDLRAIIAAAAAPALSPQPDRAKADEERLAARLLEVWDNGDNADDCLGLDDCKFAHDLIRTLSARAEAAEARAETLECRVLALEAEVRILEGHAARLADQKRAAETERDQARATAAGREG